MALTVETGSSSATADSYVSTADATTYLSNRYGSTEAFVAMGSGDDKDALMRRAASYLDNVYAARWKGDRSAGAQALAWPRTGVYDLDGYTVGSDEIPTELGYAQAEVARRLKAGTDPLSDLERSGHVKREKVGEVEVEYMDRASGDTDFRQVDGLLRHYLQGGGTTVEAVRA